MTQVLHAYNDNNLLSYADYTYSFKIIKNIQLCIMLTKNTKTKVESN